PPAVPALSLEVQGVSRYLEPKCRRHLDASTGLGAKSTLMKVVVAHHDVIPVDDQGEALAAEAHGHGRDGDLLSVGHVDLVVATVVVRGLSPPEPVQAEFRP